jgi:P pilus assembly chaperone PapD
MPFHRPPVAALGAVFAAATFGFAAPATAQIALSQVVVDFVKPQDRRADIEVENRGRDRAYVVVEPARIVAPGTAGERREQEPDPEKLGLLATPARLVLEPGEKKIVRIAAVAEAGATDRIYRVTVKPVVGRVEAKQNAVKVLVGYDVLVIQRPAEMREGLVAERRGQALHFRNGGNSNVLLYNGKLCDAAKRCVDLAAKRLYSGMEWTVRLPRPGQASYMIETGRGTAERKF